MMAWIAQNWVNLIIGALVLALVYVCARAILRGEASCPGTCSGACAGCKKSGSCNTAR